MSNSIFCFIFLFDFKIYQGRNKWQHVLDFPISLVFRQCQHDSVHYEISMLMTEYQYTNRSENIKIKWHFPCQKWDLWLHRVTILLTHFLFVTRKLLALKTDKSISPSVVLYLKLSIRKKKYNIYEEKRLFLDQTDR